MTISGIVPSVFFAIKQTKIEKIERMTRILFYIEQ
jgi:hypothetical protein